MKNIFISVVAVALVGCTYQQMVNVSTQLNMSEENVRNKIIAAAQRTKWNVCDAGNKSLRLLKENRKYSIGLIAEYSSSGYKLLVDEKTTSLRREDGTVHRRVNSLLQHTDQVIRSTNAISQGDFPRYEIEKCTDHSKTKAQRGSLVYMDRTHSNVVWVTDAKRISGDVLFSFDVQLEKGVPEYFKESTESRMEEMLTEFGVFGKGNESYNIEVVIKNFNKSGIGAVGDFMLGTGYQRLEMQASVKDPKGELICTVNASTAVPMGGIQGIVNRSSNRATGALVDALAKHLDEDIVD